MFSNYSKRVLVVSLMIAMVMLLALTSTTAASAPTNGTDQPENTTCVDGYIINHREQPVDGTKFDPPLKVYAFGMYVPPGTSVNEANLPDLPAMAEQVESLDSLMVPAEGDRSGSYMAWAEVDSNGYFKFEDMPAGYTYHFGFNLPQDWDGIVPQAPRNGTAWTGWTVLQDLGEVNGKQKCHRIVFKIRRLFDVTVLKWEELMDGTVQPGAGWDITFLPQGDPFVHKQAGTTDESGRVTFTITPGKWLVKEKVKPGWTPITPPSVYLHLDQYAPPGAQAPIIFKNRQPACKGEIEVEKIGWGRDASGRLIPLGPLAGWKIVLSRYDGNMHPISGYTDASGKVTFSGLYPGVYQVKEYVQPGWKPMSDNPQTVVLSGCDTESVTFENVETTGDLSIRGRKLYKAWVPPFKGQIVGLSGWKITATLKGSDPERTVETTTNALGEYEFSAETLRNAGIAFPGATVTVCEESRDNWIHITPKCVDVTFPYPVPPDYKGATVNFTNIQDPPLPGTGVAASTASAVAVSNCQETYLVRPGDTLSGIAASHGTTVLAIAQVNGISNMNLIRAGSTVCVR
ncbi:MAG: SpaA isopeptide-forming pilin-related protein [Chloroflexota bacterium]|nr:SpaA isopeptide-forming pilin-related protein [Chloroflexota bacterium]